MKSLNPEYEQILQEHRVWLQSAGQKGKRADLTGVDLSGLEITEGDLRGAQLERTIFSNSEIRLGDFRAADFGPNHRFPCTLTGAKFQGAILRSAIFCSNGNSQDSSSNQPFLFLADFSGADLTNAIFRGTNFQLFANPEMLSGADLTSADLSYSSIVGHNLQGTILRNTDLSHADLRAVQGCEFDTTCIREARLTPYAQDRWSVLRRRYSGAFLIINLILLAGYFLPLVAQALFWSWVGKAETEFTRSWAIDGQQLVKATKSAIARRIAMTDDKIKGLIQVVDHHLTALDSDLILLSKTQLASELVDRIRSNIVDVTNELNEMATRADDQAARLILQVNAWAVHAKGSPIHWKKSTVIAKLAGFERGMHYVLLGGLMLVYNLGRGGLTWCVGPMRDEEERSGYTPAQRSCKWLYRLHWWVLRLEIVALLAFFLLAVEIASSLYAPLWVPRNP